MGRGRSHMKRRLAGAEVGSDDASSGSSTASYFDLYVPLPREESYQAGLSVEIFS